MATNKRAIFSWCLFDWAIAPFSVLITTFVFAPYFTEKIAVNKIIGTALWGHVNAIAGLIAALLSPVLGAIADYEGRRKPWLLLVTIIVCIASANLWWAKPDVQYVAWSLAWVAIGTLAVEISMVFYNSMLNELAPPNFLGRLSGWGWGAGYIGGLCALIITLWLIFNTTISVAIVGPLTALWLILFAWPMFLWTPDHPSTGHSWLSAIRQGLKSLNQILRLLYKEHRNIFIFLLARMLYIDGLITVFAFGGIYAAGVFQMTTIEIIEFGIAMNLAAGIGATIFGWLDDLRGPKLTILLTLGLMIACGIGILIVNTKLWFWIFGMGLSLGVGPVQAASRSLFIRIVPAELITELFGFYTLSGRVTAFIGPWVLGSVTQVFASQRIGMSTVFLFMAAGGLLLLYVKKP